MIAQGPLHPNTCVDDAGIGTVAWNTPDNAKTSNDTYATVTLNNQTSHYLKVTNFGFSIPSDAEILGFVVGMEARVSVGGWSFDYVRIVKNDSIGTENSTIGPYNTTDYYQTAGFYYDMWGETWTASDVNNANFGVAVAALENTSTAYTLYVDSIDITVYYLGGERTSSPSRIVSSTRRNVSGRLLTDSRAII